MGRFSVLADSEEETKNRASAVNGRFNSEM